jgi:hypothetical protein
VPVTFDAPTRTLYVISRRPEGDGLTAFAGEEMEARAIPFPEGWYAASCTSQVPFFEIELTRRKAWFGARRPESELQRVCAADGFLMLDLTAAGVVSAAALPGVAQMNAAGAAGEMNDFVYAVNTDPTALNLADTVYVLDGAAGTAFAMALPPEVASFQGAVRFPEISAVAALGTNNRQAAGDAGVVVFDFDEERTQLFPTPEGFQSVTVLGLVANTRKLAARGNRGAQGSQLLLYDLVTGDLTVVPNPEGVVFAGMAPGQPGTPPQPAVVMQSLLTKANAVVAAGFDAERRVAGLMLVRIP